ncbi:hypothetical protein phiK7A1_109 [Pseudomonas phage phiK7A1]|uniref:Uncharacterized protein n=1 Tax=Pseudomonas phage phiK7A1 TaxID=2759194 RepID=A0A7H0XFV7_9CAUD|nr:hypothetical protein phiK7A1_109 [Pseudomonas phage phiK7A1]
MKGVDMLNLPEGTQVKLVSLHEDDDRILARIPLGTILTREHVDFIDDKEMCSFAHPDLEDGYDFFFADELELV